MIAMKKEMPFCSIVVLNYNGKEHLEECFSSIREINYPKDRYETIMVDNASKDGSIGFVKKEFPWVKILALDKNYGFTEGNNRGMAESKGKYVVVLNNDLKVDENWLLELVKVAESDKKIAACGSKVLDYKDPRIIQYAGAYLDILGSPYHRGLGEIDNGQYEKAEEVFYALDCSTLYRKEALQSLKYWYDPSFFIQCEETDLCWRLKYKGWKIVYVPKSFIYHKGGASTSKEGGIMTFYLYRNKLWMFRKNLRAPLKQAILFLVCTRMFFTILYRMLSGKWEYGFSVFRHLFDKINPDIDMTKIPLRKQLSMLSPPIISKYVQYFTGRKLWGKRQ